MTKKAVVIGAGIGGLGASLRLKAKGYDVTVYEKNDFPGGKLCESYIGGYRFDLGPSVFTMPWFVDELFELFNKNPRDYFAYKRLDPAQRFFFEDGTVIKSFVDKQVFAKEVASNTSDTEQSVLKYLDEIATIYDITKDVFVYQSLHKWSNFLSKDALRGILKFGKIKAFETMNQMNEKAFTDPKMIQFFNRYATYNGSNPYDAPGTLNVIPHYEFDLGAYLPENGMHDITKAVYKLAQEEGVKFVFESKVQQILVEKKTAVGIKVNGEIVKADLVMSNMDTNYLYDQLMPNEKAPEKILSKPKSNSGLVFYWGVKREFKDLGVHNVFLGSDYAKEMDFIHNNGALINDPTIYLNITSKKCAKDAPEGSENWFVMVNVPHDNGHDWDKMTKEIKRNVLAKFQRILKIDIEPFIEVEEILNPQKINSRYLSIKGAIYGNKFNDNFSAFFRHPNFSKKIKNLYFCGGTVHPGSSIPLSLTSAKIAVDCID